MARGQAGGATRAGGRRRLLDAASSARIGDAVQSRLGPGDGPRGSQLSCLSSRKPSVIRPGSSAPAPPSPRPSTGQPVGSSIATSSGSVRAGIWLFPLGLSLPTAALTWHRDLPEENIYSMRGWRDSCVEEWWMEGWVGEWVGSWLHEHMDGWIVGGRTDRQKHRRMDGWVGKWEER